MRRSHRTPVIALAAALLASASFAGCAGDDPSELAAREPEQLGASPIVRIAVAGPVATLDPIYASNRTERLLSRQIYEPLVSRIDPPFGVSGARRGPARPLGSEDGGRLWRFQLRPEVAFHDGSRLNADAVIANFNRWVQTGVAELLLPELDAVDSPRPGEVRFQLSEPVADFPRRLGAARLGIVSPTELPASGVRRAPLGADGTGPYELRERSATRLLLVRTPEWWGEGAGLGPGINQLDFVLTPGDLGRAEQLDSGAVSIADDLGRSAAARLGDRPLVATISDGQVTIGYSAAVRGLRSVSADQSLSELWLTELR